MTSIPYSAAEELIELPPQWIVWGIHYVLPVVFIVALVGYVITRIMEKE